MRDKERDNASERNWHHAMSASASASCAAATAPVTALTAELSMLLEVED